VFWSVNVEVMKRTTHYSDKTPQEVK